MSRSMFYNFQRNDGQATGVADPKTTYTEGQAFIGYGTQLENVLGSDHDDVIVGNNADNHLFGGAGKDDLSGGAGHDRLDGGQGADKVYSSVDYQLPAHVEQLTLTGKAKQGTGNDLDNILRGNSQDNVLDGGAGNDRLHGGAGQDRLTGGAGADTFVFDTSVADMLTTITDFTLGQDKLELSSQVFTKLNADLSNFADLIQYDSATGEVKYKATNDFVTFAKLTPGLNLTASDFVIKDSQLPERLVVAADPALIQPETPAPAIAVPPSTIAQIDDFRLPDEKFPTEGLQGFGQDPLAEASASESEALETPSLPDPAASDLSAQPNLETSASASQNNQPEVILQEAPGDLSNQGGFCPCCGMRRTKDAGKFSLSDDQLTSFAGRLLAAEAALDHQPRVIQTGAWQD